MCPSHVGGNDAVRVAVEVLSVGPKALNGYCLQGGTGVSCPIGTGVTPRDA